MGTRIARNFYRDFPTDKFFGRYAPEQNIDLRPNGGGVCCTYLLFLFFCCCCKKNFLFSFLLSILWNVLPWYLD